MFLALALGLLTTGANMIGSYLAVARRSPHPTLMNALVGVSGGFILGVALLEMVPEALEGGGLVPAFIVAGYLATFLIEHYFAAHAHEQEAPQPVAGGADGEDEHTLHTEFRHTPRAITTRAAVAAFFGFLLHDFLDGLAIGAAMVTQTALGLLVFLGVLLHEVPAGLSVATIMRSAGWSRLSSFLSGVAIGLVTLPGIMLPFLLGEVESSLTYIFLALSAGTFIYIATSILIPAAGASRSRLIVLSVVGGFLLFWATQFLVSGALE